MHPSYSTTGRPERRRSPRSITARNNDARQRGHQKFADKVINGAANVTYQRIIDYCGTHTSTRAALDTIAASLPGRSSATSGKSVSSIKGHLRQLRTANLVWLDELGIHITALEAEPIATQQPFPDLDEACTLELIATEIKAAADRGDFAAVARLAAEADTLRERDAADVPAEENEAASRADSSPGDESKNCPKRVKKLPVVKRQINPSDVKHQNLLNPRQSARAACRPHGGGGRSFQQRTTQSPVIPDNEATRLLIIHGFEDPATIRECSAAPLAVIMDAYHRRMEVGGGPGLEAKVIREGRWKSCGKRVDNRPAMPPLDDEEGWRERYIGGELGRYIIGGPTDAPPAVDDDAPPEPEPYPRDAEHALIDSWVPPALRPMPAPPDDDPELEKYRSSLSVPPWMREGGDA